MRYIAPTSVEETCNALAEADDARILAGGTDLLVQIRSGSREPTLVVDIKKINETRSITKESGGFRIGAAVTGAELGEAPDVSTMWPGIVEALELIGSTQIQGRASLGGNVCNASPAADSVPALIAGDISCTIAGPSQQRDIKVADICTHPGKTILAKDEFIVSFFLPVRANNARDAYLRFIPRTEMDIAVVGAGVNLTVDADGVCTSARVALGAVGPRAILVPEAGDALIGTNINNDALENMAQATRAACDPIDDKRGTIEFRIKVAGVLAKRATAKAYDRARIH